MSAHSKPTPGRWYADIGECANVRCDSTSVRHEDGGLIAQCMHLRGAYGCAGCRSADEVAANARLIAAAPDLLEAARHAVTEWRLHGALTDSCRALERAIARAEGKP